MAKILISKVKRMQVFNLDSRVMIMLRSRRVNMQVMTEHRDGGSFPKAVSKRIVDSLTVPAGAKVRKFSDGGWLPDDIVKVPCIAEAIARREIGVVTWDPTVPVKKKPSRNAGDPRATVAATNTSADAK